MCRHRSIFIVMLIFVCFSAKAFAEPTLLVGFIDEHWITGLTFQHSQRELVGFFGYKEDFLSSAFAVTNNDSHIAGYAVIGQEAFLGNIRYKAAVYGGNPDFDKNILSKNKLGVTGDVMKLSGTLGYGVEAEINPVGYRRFKLSPYVQKRNRGTIRAALSFESYPQSYKTFLELVYSIKPQSFSEIELFGRYEFGEQLDYGVSLTLADNLVLSGRLNTDNELSLGLNWKSVKYPFNVSINRQNDHLQWLVGYRF